MVEDAIKTKSQHTDAIVISMLSKPKSLLVDRHQLSWLRLGLPCPLGGIDDKCHFPHKENETRGGQEKSTQGVLLISGQRTGLVRVTGATFIWIFWIFFLLLKECGMTIWAAQTGISTDNPLGWFDAALPEDLQFLYSLKFLDQSLLCLGETATCLWQLGSFVRPAGQPAKGQQQEQTSSLIRLLLQWQGKRFRLL